MMTEKVTPVLLTDLNFEIDLVGRQLRGTADLIRQHLGLGLIFDQEGDPQPDRRNPLDDQVPAAAAAKLRDPFSHLHGQSIVPLGRRRGKVYARRVSGLWPGQRWG